MKISKQRLREIIREELTEAGPWSRNITGSSGKKSKGKTKTEYQGYSSKEAKNIIDKGLKNYVKVLRKAQQQVIKDWMSKAKSGVVDYFDFVRGLKTGDIRRAHLYEIDFLFKVLTRDKIIDRFRSYFGGKKGMRKR